MKYFLTILILISSISCSQQDLNKKIVDELKERLALQQLLQIGVVISPTEKLSQQEVKSLSDCEEFKKNLPADYFHGYLEVPENPDSEKGTKIKVFYYGKINPEQTPIVFFNGGPGGSSWSSYSVLSRQQNIIGDWKKASFVFIDQRGNGCSDPYPQGSSLEVFQRLANYGTRGIVADSEAVRKHLIGNKPWKVFGQSYGADIVHRYVEQAPGSVVSATAHGNALKSSGDNRFLQRIYSQKRVLENYLSLYPEDLKIIENLRVYLKAETCFKDPYSEQEDCGLAFLSPFVRMLGFATSWSRMHTWLNVIWDEQGFNENKFKEFISMYYFSPTTPGYTQGWAQLVLAHADRNFLVTCEDVKTGLLKMGIDPNSILLNECLREFQLGEEPLNPDTLKKLSQIPKNHLSLEQFKKKLEQHPNLPFYLYSGNLDCFVPMESFPEEVDQLKGRIFYKNFLGTGHDGFYTEPLVWKNLLKH